ncbi:Rid family detoxifying hydrolase [Sediminicoccus sp. KRV36]|uniref:Rid family detoxifying hydrolase n=1 Tax=Sediminicoccus sp. KRV36 TaxID=3133721 RepID=UPI00200CDE3B|nr:Rid family detoxifying hydrolase [Sediminicoccus rosea]UPY38456.1 Rid family detoxifying hydrolase [Sediminicoccus rosea]
MTARLALLLLALATPALVQPARSQPQVISTPDSPAAIGPYSQALRVGNTLYLAGQIALDPATNQMISDRSIEAETRRVLDNLKAVVEAAGFRMSDIVTTTVFMADLNEFARMNAVYATYFPTNPPARATVQAGRLPRDAKVEIVGIAAR